MEPLVISQGSIMNNLAIKKEREKLSTLVLVTDGQVYNH